MGKIMKIKQIMALLIAVAVTAGLFVLAGCDGNNNEPAETARETATQQTATTTAAETATQTTEEVTTEAESEITSPNAELIADTIARLEELGCTTVPYGENRLGMEIVSIDKVNDGYKIVWSCATTDSNPRNATFGSNAHDVLMFTLIRFFDPDDFSNNHQVFTIEDEQINYTFGDGDLITWKEFRLREFEPLGKVVYMYFAGATDGAPSEIQTPPMFFTLILGDNPEIIEDSPRLANGIFDGYYD
ncbi:MAG: hypothetical protein FWH07_06830 [Oscillospiraceae bacterium]|nr:hypothetical protein [Oscillospiraceae bacterium]